MKRTTAIKKITVKDFLLQFILSFAAAQVIIQIGHWTNPFKLMQHPRYLYAMLSSMVIAFILIQYVYWCTYLLERHLPIGKHPKLRPYVQAFLGVAIPCLLAIGLAAVYYAKGGYNLLDTHYFDSIFPTVAIMLILLNFIYNSGYWVPKLSDYEKVKQDLAERDAYIEKIRKAQKERFIAVNNSSVSTNDIQMIRAKEKTNLYITRAGDQLAWPYALKDSIEKYLGDAYVMISKSVIVRYDNIKDVHDATSRRDKLELYIPAGETVLVSQRKAKELRDILDELRSKKG